MSDQRLRIFISSKMQELAAEREAIKAALDELHVEAWVFEKDAGARPQTIQETYLEEVEAADLYIGLFWKGYGPYTIEEYEHAEMLGMDCLIYEKRDDIQGQRDSELQAFLDRISAVENGLTIKWFNTPDDLRKFVKEDVAAWQARIIRQGRKFSSQEVYVGVPPMPPHFVGRGDLVQKMVRQFRSGEDLAVEGLPGVGKTTLAVALARHLRVRRNFKDGILWASLGPHADLASTLTSWAEALKLDITRSISEPERAQAIRDAIGQKRMLLVIDDVWDFNAAEALRCGGPNCCHLVTTRDKSIARKLVGTAWVKSLPTLDEDQAYELLEALAPEACTADPDAVRSLGVAVDGLPLAIRLIGGYLAAPEHSMFPDLFPDLSDEALAELKDPKKRLQLAEQRLGVLSGEKITLQDTIALSLHGLPNQAKTAFYALGAFAPKPARFGREAADAVTRASGSTLSLLAARNLLEIEPKERQLAVHPTIADVARTKLDEAAAARHREHYWSLIIGCQSPVDRLFLISKVYQQLWQAWQFLPEDASLLDWLSTMRPYFYHSHLYKEHLEWEKRAVVMATNLKLHDEKAYLLAQIAFLYGRLCQWESAIEYSKQALPLLEEIGDRAGFARTLLNIGRFYYELGKSEKVSDYILRAIPICKEAGDTWALNHVKIELSRFYRDAGKAKEAAAVLEGLDSAGEATIDITSVALAQNSIEINYLKKTSLPLMVLESFMRKDEPHEFSGTIAIGVKREDGSFDYWKAVFSEGKTVQTVFLDHNPSDADACLLLSEKGAYNLVAQSSVDVSELGLLECSGNLDLLDQFSKYISRDKKNGERS